MSDLISRQAAIDALMPIYKNASLRNRNVFSTARKCMAAIEDLPSAQPERKKGMWQEITEGDCSGYDPTLAGYDDPVVGYVCSCCRDGYEKEVMGDTLFNFCPNCGADMRTAKQIIHDAIDNTPMAEDVYVGIKEKLHKAVDAVDELSSEGEE